MADQRPQYYDNTLAPVDINATSLADCLQQFREAVCKGSELIHENSPVPDKWDTTGFFRGFPGVALGFLRLHFQSPILADENAPPPDYRQWALQRIPSSLSSTLLIPSRLSPIGSLSPLTAVVLHVLAALSDKTNDKPTISSEDGAILEEAVNLALKNGPLVPHGDRKMGADEMLYGRAGLLWTLLNIRTHTFDEETEEALAPILNQIPDLIHVIIDAGRQGSKDYIEKYGEADAHPLMYVWHEGFYGFGAVHGMTGILAILLACKPGELKPYLSDLGGTITTICKLCIANNGHLPMSIPSFKSESFGPHLLQICHGSPGILTLMAAALKNRPLAEAFWQPEWDQAIHMATERTWEEGLLSKGGSLCHGIAGNAYPWLLLHDCYEASEYIDNPRQAYLQREKTSTLPDVCRTLTGDFFLSRALAFLLHARDTRPYNTAPAPSDRDYRPPDDPWSLFEGLPGTVCAWADACAVVQARLRQMELGVSVYTDPTFQEARRSQLGFPGLGGNGVPGVF